ncbi:hypothetical protein [Brevibacillus daliensis]|uniref:hypothetical protein n=1 Tax=Brevibacillus daliensis TaxID=2892995 RepID=UPI001E459A13|nr:hypothetical protein [Brevibacillus daliensis]
MGQDLISNLLGKLSEKTGREWSIHDIYRLAQKIPEVNSKNINSVLDEITDMGLTVSKEARDQVMSKVKAKDYNSIKNQVLNHPIEQDNSSAKEHTSLKEKSASHETPKKPAKSLPPSERKTGNKKKSEGARVSLHEKKPKSKKEQFYDKVKRMNQKRSRKRNSI